MMDCPQCGAVGAAYIVPSGETTATGIDDYGTAYRCEVCSAVAEKRAERRERIATRLLCESFARMDTFAPPQGFVRTHEPDRDYVTRQAVEWADALIAQLDGGSDGK